LPGGSRKKRPFVIVSSDAFNRNELFRKVMVVHLTSAPRHSGPYDWEVSLPQGTAGLPAASIAKCAEVYTFHKDHLSELVGTLPLDFVHRIDRALAIALALRVPAEPN